MPKSLVLIKSGRKPEFALQEQRARALQPHEIRVEVHYAGINFADVMMMLGMYPDAPKLPAAPGYEIAGVITEAGDEASLRPGDRVVGSTMFGGYTEEVVVPASNVVSLPDSVGLDAAVTLPVNYLTAAVALIDMCRVRTGDRVLVHGGAGGVGRMALHIAKAHGAETFATVSSNEKFEIAKEAGADYIINYKTQDFAAEINGITKDYGVDIILDPVGGKTFTHGTTCLTSGGRIVLFGLAAGVAGGKRSLWRLSRAFFRTLRFAPMPLMNHNIGVYGLNLRNYPNAFTRPRLIKYLQQAVQATAAGKLKTLVHRVYPLADGQQALEELASGTTVGKIILDCRTGR